MKVDINDVKKFVTDELNTSTKYLELLINIKTQLFLPPLQAIAPKLSYFITITMFNHLIH